LQITQWREFQFDTGDKMIAKLKVVAGHGDVQVNKGSKSC